MNQQQPSAALSPPMAQSDGSSGPVEWGIVLKYLWTMRAKLILSVVAGTLVAVAVAFGIAPYYTASASFVPPASSSGSSLLVSQLGSLGASGLLGGVGKSSGELYLAILHSRGVSQRMIQRFSLLDVYHLKHASQAEAALEQHTKFTLDVKSSIVTIQVTDKEPERARDMANAFLEQVQKQSTDLALTESSQRRLFYEDRLASEKASLADAEVALKQTEEHTGLISPVGQTSVELQSIAGLRADLAARQVRLAALLHDETDQNPDVLRLQSEIGSLQGQLQQRQKNGTQGEIATSQVPALALEYIRKQRDVKYHETLFEVLAKQYESARLDEAHDPPLQVLDYAVLPDVRAGPPRALIVVAGAVLSFLLACLWCVWRAARLKLWTKMRVASVGAST